MALSAPPKPEYVLASDGAERLFGVDMWETPREILNAVFRPRSRVAVKACHASSKTHTAAIAVALALYEGADVLTTAPTWEQVRTVLWGEVHRLLAGSVIPLSEWGAINQTEIVMPDGSHALGLSTNEGVRFQGWHARPDSFLLLIGDEAPGVRPDIFEAWEGISAGGDVRHLLLGNPVIASGNFYDIFTGSSSNWRRLTVDAFDTPNLAGLTLDDLLRLPDHELDANPRPYLVDRRWVRDRYYEWGVDHALWQSRVRGRFPDQASNSLISLAWLEAARARPAAYAERGGDVIAGVDVAGPGKDETVVYLRQGNRILEMQTFPDADSRGRVLQALQPWLHKSLKRVNVDSAGDGHYFTAHLRDYLPQSIEVAGINVGTSATDTPDKDGRLATDQFANLKAELYWHLREQFKSGMVSGLTDQTTISQLASLQWAPNSRGKTEIERKEVAAKRGVKSPDRAEALMLCMAPSSADALLAKAWQGQSENVLPAHEKRFMDTTSRRNSTEQSGWLVGTKF